jgi:methyl-accepting chemotaxis protein
MFNLHHKSDLLQIERFSCALTQAQAKLEAISRSMAMIEFDPDGTILEANENFCKTVGYTADEIRGKHHRFSVKRPTSNPASTASYGAT